MILSGEAIHLRAILKSLKPLAKAFDISLHAFLRHQTVAQPGGFNHGVAQWQRLQSTIHRAQNLRMEYKCLSP